MRGMDAHHCPGLPSLVFLHRSDKVTAVYQAHAIAFPFVLRSPFGAQDHGRVIVMAGSSPDTPHFQFRASHQVSLQAPLHGMPAREGNEFIIPILKIQAAGKALGKGHLAASMVFYPHRPGYDVFLLKNPVIQAYCHIRSSFLHGDHQCLPFFIFRVKKGGHPCYLIRIRKDLVSAETEIRRYAAVAVHQLHTAAPVVPHAAGGQLLGQAV